MGRNRKNKDEIQEYREAIREMIKSENEIRNQRTNWFLVIQGFLIAGICQLPDSSYLPFFIAMVGYVSSVAFRHAAWRSTLAVSYVLACWENHVGDLRTKLPPVSLITKEILDTGKLPSIPDSWQIAIWRLMNRDKTRTEILKDRKRNKCDYLLPYRLLPALFCVFWLLYFIGNYKIILQLIGEVSKLLNNISAFFS